MTLLLFGFSVFTFISSGYAPGVAISGMFVLMVSMFANRKNNVLFLQTRALLTHEENLREQLEIQLLEATFPKNKREAFYAFTKKKLSETGDKPAKVIDLLREFMLNPPAPPSSGGLSETETEEDLFH